jgi:haloacetate dehalogenase
MSGEADFFPGFAVRSVETGIGPIFARVGGRGPPLLCLHGFPETHAMWHRVSARLAERFTVVAADLPGYGMSAIPDPSTVPEAYAKSAMAAVMKDAMAALGFRRFALLAHDRGARVAYRLALDHPAAVDRAILLDIVATLDVWESFADPDAARLMGHWTFLAQPPPLPETLIGGAADHWLESRFVRGGATRPAWLTPDLWAHYKACHDDPLRRKAHCDDYRAGATLDIDADRRSRDRGDTIAAPLLVLWGSRGNLATHRDPLALWRRWCPNVTGGAVDSGHYIPEESPDDLLAAILPFLADHSAAH